MRVRPKEVRLARVQVGGLDHSGGEVVGEVPVDEAAPQVSVAAMHLDSELIQSSSLNGVVNTGLSIWSRNTVDTKLKVPPRYELLF